MAEINCNPGGNPNAGQDILATSQVRVGGACYSFPWGCLKCTGGLQTPGYGHILQSDIATHNYCKQSQPPALWVCMPSLFPRKRWWKSQAFLTGQCPGSSL